MFGKYIDISIDSFLISFPTLRHITKIAMGGLLIYVLVFR